MRCLTAAALMSTAFWWGPVPAEAACQLSKYVELPVTMVDRRPLVSAQIDGKDVQLILDSGAFYSTLSAASAQTYGLHPTPLPLGFDIRGVNGSASASAATVRKFGLGGYTLPGIQFVVGGTDTGQVGLLGQNFLGIDDVEYDLGHGVVRLLHAKGCQAGDLPYWAAGRVVTIVPLEPRTPQQKHTIGTVTLNGVKLRALFDTGAANTIVTLGGAKRAGLTPDSPGVEPGGSSIGIGTHLLRTWMGRFKQLDIGGEAVPNPRLRFGDVQLGGVDMLIGADFFLTHHLYVANKADKMFVTYDGGPVFGINPRGATDPQGKPLDLTDRAAAPTDAEGFARQGAVLASNGRIADALADFDRAVALAPDQARYRRQRAAARIANRQPLLAAADLDRALTLDPSDAEAHEMRAQMRLRANDPAGAGEDIRALDTMLPPAAGQRLAVAGLAEAAGLLDIALANEDAWLTAHREDAKRPVALNGRCWVRVRMNRDLGKALDDCNAALRAQPGNAGFLDSRALVRLRQGDVRGALADYDLAVKNDPRNGWALYMRGLARRKAGDGAGADADRAAALAVAPKVGERVARMGLDKL